MALISRDKRAQHQATIPRAFMNKMGVKFHSVIKVANTNGTECVADKGTFIHRDNETQNFRISPRD